jgi:hypothetical protein
VGARHGGAPGGGPVRRRPRRKAARRTVPGCAVTPGPLLNVEVEPWTLPPAAARFGLHPVGVVPLYQRAHSVLDGVGLLAGLDDDDLERVAAECWRIASEVFTPGEAVRSSLERVVQERAIRPNLMGQASDEDKLRVLQLGYVAAWAVFRAAGDLAREAV